MDKIVLGPPSGKLEGTIDLPYSKSEYNRALILEAISQGKISIEKSSDSLDSQDLKRCLSDNSTELDAGNGGTTYRFLAAYFAAIGMEKKLFGSKRMYDRPIAPLVDGLRTLGAKIDYLEKEGFPPLHIHSDPDGLRSNGPIMIDSSSSSQFLSALLLVSPLIENGIEIKIDEDLVSASYLKMTLRMLHDSGLKIDRSKSKIRVAGSIKETTLKVGRDWSSASFWYCHIALNPGSSIVLNGLESTGLQGDEVLKDLGDLFGWETEFNAEGTLVKWKSITPSKRDINLSSTPDLAPPLMVLAAIKDLPYTFSGIEHLRIKESDRLASLDQELTKAGLRTISGSKGGKYLIEKLETRDPQLVFKSYNDHRMAMALSLFANQEQVEIQNPDVVKKSYPTYWEDMKDQSFQIKEN